MKNKSKPVVLVSPLDWGIGHASRVVPVINKLIENNFKIILGISGRSGEFLKSAFPDLSYISLPFTNIRYGKAKSFFFLLLQIPFFIISVLKEHNILKRKIKQYKIELIISDNRYGLWNKKIFSVLITHQLFIKLPGYITFLQPFIWFVTNKMINKFDECWIPDLPDFNKSLSGKLSHGFKMPDNFHFIGLLSRFCSYNSMKINRSNHDYLLVILSGPEYQRTIIEEKIIDQIKSFRLKAIILRGLPSMQPEKESIDGIQFYNHVSDKEFANLVMQSKGIICRSGYSTIMDLICLGKSAILIPTPGQTEQEYLANYLSSKGLFLNYSQNKFNLKLAFESNFIPDDSQINKYKITKNLLDPAIENLMNKICK